MKVSNGDILSVNDGIVVQGCNAKGVMGSGLAKQIRDKFPEVYKEYREKFESSGLPLGSVVWSEPNEHRAFFIANAITQNNYGRNPNIVYADYNAIRDAFREISKVAREKNLKVHYPMIGAGLGNGKWEIISKIIEEELQGIDHNLWIYEKKVPKFKR